MSSNTHKHTHKVKVNEIFFVKLFLNCSIQWNYTSQNKYENQNV